MPVSIGDGSAPEAQPAVYVSDSANPTVALRTLESTGADNAPMQEISYFDPHIQLYGRASKSPCVRPRTRLFELIMNSCLRIPWEDASREGPIPSKPRRCHSATSQSEKRRPPLLPTLRITRITRTNKHHYFQVPARGDIRRH